MSSSKAVGSEGWVELRVGLALRTVYFILILFFIFLLFRVALTAYGGSQARGLIRATATSLHHNHSNGRS